MRSFSYWERKHFWNKTEYVVIGSGITGLTSAIFMRRARPHAGVTVLERGVLPTGASTRNAGFACFGSPSELLDDLKVRAERDVFELVEKRYKGLKLLRELLSDAMLGYEPTGGYEIFRESETETYQYCLGSLGYLNAELVNAIGKQVYWDAEVELPAMGFGGVKHMLVNREEGMIDTGLMMKSLIQLAVSEGVQIFTGVEVDAFAEKNGSIALDTNLGTMEAGHLLVATNAFARKLLPQLEVEPCRAQVLITKPVEGITLQGCFHHDRGYNYFRNIDGRVLLGGGRQTDLKSEATDRMETTDAIQMYLEGLLREVILPGKKFEIEQRWSGIMGMGNSKDVIVKQTGPGVVCAVRFGGMGVALGSYAGREAANMLLNV